MAYKLGPTDKKETTAFLESRLAKAISTNEITLNTVLKKPVSPIEVTHTQSNSNLGPRLTSIKVTCVKGHVSLFL